MPLLSCACLCNNSKLCLPSFVSPSSCIVVLLQCFYCTVHVLLHKWRGVLSREKHPLQQHHSKKEGGRIFEGGLIFGRLRYIINYTSSLLTCLYLNACMYVLSLAGQARLLYILAISSSRVASARSLPSEVLVTPGKPPKFLVSCPGYFAQKMWSGNETTTIFWLAGLFRGVSPS